MHNNQIKHAEVIEGNEMHLITGSNYDNVMYELMYKETYKAWKILKEAKHILD